MYEIFEENKAERDKKRTKALYCPNLTRTISFVLPLLYQTSLILLQNKASVDTFLPQIMPLYIFPQKKACVDIIYRGCHVHYLYYYVIFYEACHLNDIVNFSCCLHILLTSPYLRVFFKRGNNHFFLLFYSLFFNVKCTYVDMYMCAHVLWEGVKQKVAVAISA